MPAHCVTCDCDGTMQSKLDEMQEIATEMAELLELHGTWTRVGDVLLRWERIHKPAV